MAAEQNGLTMVAPVVPARRAALLAALAAVDDEFRQGCARAGGHALPLGDIDSLHFARLAIGDFGVDPKGCGDPRLIFCLDFDGPADALLDALAVRAGDGLDRLFAHCVGYPAGPTATARVRRFLEQQRVHEHIHYTGAPGRTVEQIRAEAHLRQVIQCFVTKQRRALSTRTSAEVRAAIQAYVRRQRGPRGERLFAWAEARHPTPTGTSAAAFRLAMVRLVANAMRSAVRDMPQWAAEWVRARFVEPPRNPPLTCAEQDYVQRDNLSGPPGGQNKMTSLTVARPGYLWLVAFGIDAIRARVLHEYFRGELAGIVTIHFARWVLVDRCVLFCSVYDGSWEAYLGEFIDRASEGLNTLWGSTVGYPATRGLTAEGARNEQRFKSWVVRHQVPTQVFYSAYPELSIATIRRNTRLRDGLFATMDDKREIDTWLALL